MYFSDPTQCTYCQNHGVINAPFIAGVCHRCQVSTMWEAAVRANRRRHGAQFAMLRLKELGLV